MDISKPALKSIAGNVASWNRFIKAHRSYYTLLTSTGTKLVLSLRSFGRRAEASLLSQEESMSLNTFDTVSLDISTELSSLDFESVSSLEARFEAILQIYLPCDSN